MKITWQDHLTLIAKIYRILFKYPMPMWQKYHLLANPVDSTRYVEFTCLLKSLSSQKFDQAGKAVLDISSPYIMAYILAEKANVIKTDINILEKRSIHETPSLKFRQEDALSLTFPDASFDMAYAISVIEHIHGRYLSALSEMMRVIKPGGYLYVTFPVAEERREEWTQSDPYGHQHRDGKRCFFQYVFDEITVKQIIDHLKSSGDLCAARFFFEKDPHGYDKLMRSSRARKFMPLWRNGIASFIYACRGIRSLGEDSFGTARGVGTACILVRKRAS